MTPQDFIALLQKHGVAFHEKHKGQLFCDHSAEDIIKVLLAECAAGQVTHWQGCSIKNIVKKAQSALPTDEVCYEINSKFDAAGWR